MIARRPGMAARQQKGPAARSGGNRAARVAQGCAGLGPRLLNVHDGTRSLANAPMYASFQTEGRNPRTSRWPAWFEDILPGAPRSTIMDAATANAANVARTICTVRGFSGSGGGLSQPPVYRSWKLTNEADSRAESFRNEVFLSSSDTMAGTGDPNQPANDMLAREMGHVMDWVHAPIATSRRSG